MASNLPNPLYPPLPNTDSRETLTFTGLSSSRLALTISNILAQSARPVCIITEDTLTAERLEDELHFFCGGMATTILHLPDRETLPYDRFSPHRDIISNRLETLHRLPSLKKGAIILPIATLMHRLCPADYLQQFTFLLNTGETMHIEALRLRLEKSGYRCVSEVREHGEFAVRGSIIDLFPMGSRHPYRIDLLDNEVDSIRIFSPDTQRTLEKTNKIALLPAHEFPLTNTAIDYFRSRWRSEFAGNPLNCPIYQDISNGIPSPGLEYYLPLFFEKTATLFDYLPPDALIIQIGMLHTKAEEFFAEITARHALRANELTHPILPPAQLFLSVPEVFQQCKQYAGIKILSHTETSAVSNKQQKNSIHFAMQDLPDLAIQATAENPFENLKQFIHTWPGTILFCTESAGRRELLLQQLAELAVYPATFTSWADARQSAEKFGVLVAPFENSFCLTEPALAVITENKLSGARVSQKRRRRTETPEDTDAIVRHLAELQKGAPVVHIEHGIGRYQGLITLTVENHPAEFLLLEYADQAKLYVPVNALQCISRYSGIDPDNVPLSRLGSGQWQRARQKAFEDIRDVAAELLEIHAGRAAQKGYCASIPDNDYTRFAAAFPFEETPDQLRAIQDVMNDLRSPRPMDRLICGDVGFGKTEVAMRAAFIAVQNNRQVAVLVPTTLLANQHYQNFLDRFADWPIRIAMLSRFKSAIEQKKILQQLADGQIDIVIGTHRLLQKNIAFKSLGLLIIDEEHRFGVQQKEHLKKLRLNVDILTLTATPIPRTLSMAFSGMRDLSIIATPPAKRLAVKTFVMDYALPVIQEAVLREILRGGQVYFLHNDVSTIERMAQDLEKAIPEARVGIAHGQMRERELEIIMSDFYHRRFNLLVCSTIIESGIDIPSANTIIIHRADKLGLAQLHQLRGRVGRSHHQAYAYLLVPSRKNLSSDAEKRLTAIAALEDLGAGFLLATQDLEIRGAGELLGEGQSGNMQAIGFTMYMDLLTRATDALRDGKPPILSDSSPKSTEIDLHVPALIPDQYLPDVELRLQCYRRIAMTKTAAELDAIQIEMIDRFGLLPPQAKALFTQALLRQEAEKLGIQRIDASARQGRLIFPTQTHDTTQTKINPMKIIKLLQEKADVFRLDGPTKLIFSLPEHPPEARPHFILKILAELTGE